MSTVKRIFGTFALLMVALIASCSMMSMGLSRTADTFLQALAANDNGTAYQQLSNTFKAGTPADELSRFVQQHYLNAVQSTRWIGSSTHHRSGVTTGSVNGELTYMNGVRAPIHFDLVKENNAWKINNIRVGAQGVAPQTLAKAAPGPEVIKRIARDSTNAFTAAVRQRDMGHLYHATAQMWQRETSPAQLNEVFKGFMQDGINLDWVTKVPAQITSVPSLSDTGVLKFGGEHRASDALFTFEYTYVFEGLDWKLIGTNVNVKPI